LILGKTGHAERVAYKPRACYYYFIERFTGETADLNKSLVFHYFFQVQLKTRPLGAI
jgi:hypothetical protein